MFLALSLMLFSCDKNGQIYAEFQKSEGFSGLCFIIKTNEGQDKTTTLKMGEGKHLFLFAV